MFILFFLLFLYLHGPDDCLYAQTSDSTPQTQNESSSQTHTQAPEKNLSKLEQNEGGKKKEEDKEKEKDSPHKLTGSVAFLSDYRSRGISQTFLRPSVQGELDYKHTSGFYFKSWGSNIDGTTHLINNASSEWNFYIGFRHSLFNTQVEYDVGFLYYYYPGGHAFVRANTSYDTVEYYFAFEYKKFELKLSLTLNDFFGVNSSNPPINWDTRKAIKPNGHSYGSPYIEANYEYSFYPKWKASFHIGYQAVIHYPQLNYLDWLIGVTREFAWFEASLSYVQTNSDKTFYNIPDHSFHSKRVDLGGAGAIFSINKTF